MKVVIVVFLLLALGALGSAGFFMLRHKDDAQRDRRMATALAIRVALSVALFLLILFAYWMGWIHPHGIPIGS